MDIIMLNFELKEVIAEQKYLFDKIKTLSTDPALTGELLCRVTDSAVRYNDLCMAINDEVHRKDPFWKRTFTK